ncbi:hypothetical protein [Mucilaginibacter sp. CSA2-8R]|uniref:hypothetical protein n=1 Tax=Mucilaginibacter sp. CSA2-8R TaxID=3141542 RepID=UPI00315D1546
MNTVTLDFLRKVYRKAFNRGYNGVNYATVDVKNQEASDLIKSRLLSDEPVMICRFGSIELDCVANYISINKNKGAWFKYISGKIDAYWWQDNIISAMSNNAGFFPSNPSTLEKFSLSMIEDMKQVDILGSWLEKEKLFTKELAHATRVQIGDLHPYNHANPWSEALKDKKVLVIHPFEDSIKSQFSKRDLIFKDQRILPPFELKTIKAVQSIANNKTPFKTWFDALDYMKEQIDKTDFDIAILGCGAYGFPLAAHIKRIGKKAVHLGGPTQVLFGIIGKRWEEDKVNSYVMTHFANEHWVRPSATETPSGIKNVEAGCYW